MTDPVDELLHEEGARWRAEQPPAPRPDVTRWRNRRWLTVAVAAGVVLIAAGGVHAITRPAESVPFGVAEDSSLVVREGAEVEATGRITGTPMRFCAPAATSAINAGTCRFSVPVTGLDTAPDGVVRLRGVWKAGVLEVRQRLDPLPDPVRDWGTPCAPPAGGWRSGQADGKELHSYVLDQHPEQFRRPWASFPDGQNGVDVLVVEVVAGDVQAAGRELKSRYDGNLCVVDAAGKPSLKDQKGIRDAVFEPLQAIMRDQANGVYGLGGTDTVQVDLVMLTPALAERFERISPALELRPWLRPVR
ncbi:hypothetical protein ABZX92_43120 [Lentzea sp. NPDC006480]|uniref:hypothetical protein n=1 Tax=Lentzea sp. NPDC006480 TaxID=3157176 RepID=UPI00339E11CB